MVTTRREDGSVRPEGGRSEVHALVLAGGEGTRMGGDKLRRLWRSKPLVTWAVESALASPAEAVWLVTGSDPGLGDLFPSNPRWGFVHATDWAQGMSATLKAGIAALPEEVGAVLISLGDMPSLPPNVTSRLIEAWRNGAMAVAPVHDGQRGHPVLLDRSLFSAVTTLTGDRGAGALLASLGNGLALIPCDDPGVLFDIDTPEALQA